MVEMQNKLPSWNRDSNEKNLSKPDSKICKAPILVGWKIKPIVTISSYKKLAKIKKVKLQKLLRDAKIGKNLWTKNCRIAKRLGKNPWMLLGKRQGNSMITFSNITNVDTMQKKNKKRVDCQRHWTWTWV